MLTAELRLGNLAGACLQQWRCVWAFLQGINHLFIEGEEKTTTKKKTGGRQQGGCSLFWVPFHANPFTATSESRSVVSFENPWTIPIVHGILQAGILQWVAFPFSREPSQPRSPAFQAHSSPAELPGKPMNTGGGSLSLLQGIFLTQESNRGLLHCRRLL